MKKSKKDLYQDHVESNHFHVGVELELIVPFDPDKYDSGCCDCGDEDCDNVDEDNVKRLARNELVDEIVKFTGNSSVKVVHDGSIQLDGSNELDAEVCWNYFASKETVRDNKKILTYLENFGAKFDTSCGLHLNLNNYLKVPINNIKTEELAFLFNYVAPSRRDNRFCTNYGMSSREKYSMIYHQNDRLEFRFFSPTLDPIKLNMYIRLANFIYRRLAGKKMKMPKVVEAYFLNKMVNVNNVDLKTAKETIKLTKRIKKSSSYGKKPRTKASKPTEVVINSSGIITNDFIAGYARNYNISINAEEIGEILRRIGGN